MKVVRPVRWGADGKVLGHYPQKLASGLPNHESVSLAFLATLQLLPGRQRAVLILRDVLGWQAREVAELLDLTVAAVNSALQRARATLKKHRAALASETIAPASDERTATLLSRYVAAWETADVTRLVALLRDDAIYSMPPLPQWYRGRAAIQTFLETYLFVGPARGRFRLRSTQANGCPAFASYVRDEAGVYRPSALQVLTLADGQIARIHGFLAFDHQLFAHFGLPPAG
jgi:RNA polymerase sigma-70 factor (ECF subfamily)